MNPVLKSAVHGIIVGIVVLATYALSAGGEWQTVTLGTVAAFVLHFLQTAETKI
ncbi:MAG: hypothetical protein KGJ90_04905 [Patescibacteria group bacterium]|nr:hypothetical protein [Patescibacteria group bacterium]